MCGECGMTREFYELLSVLSLSSDSLDRGERVRQKSLFFGVWLLHDLVREGCIHKEKAQTSFSAEWLDDRYVENFYDYQGVGDVCFRNMEVCRDGIAELLLEGGFLESFYTEDVGLRYKICAEKFRLLPFFNPHKTYDHLWGISDERGKISSLDADELTSLVLELKELLIAKNASYGDAFYNSAKILSHLYPSGVPCSSYENMLCILRILDKLSRIATSNDKFDESPWEDIAGYALLQLYREKNE